MQNKRISGQSLLSSSHHKKTLVFPKLKHLSFHSGLVHYYLLLLLQLTMMCMFPYTNQIFCYYMQFPHTQYKLVPSPTMARRSTIQNLQNSTLLPFQSFSLPNNQHYIKQDSLLINNLNYSALLYYHQPYGPKFE